MGSQPIQRSQLETATRMERVDKLAQVYGENGAVRTTLDALYRMRQNDLAGKLFQGNASIG